MNFIGVLQEFQSEVEAVTSFVFLGFNESVLFNSELLVLTNIESS